MILINKFMQFSQFNNAGKILFKCDLNFYNFNHFTEVFKLYEWILSLTIFTINYLQFICNFKYIFLNIYIINNIFMRSLHLWSQLYFLNFSILSFFFVFCIHSFITNYFANYSSMPIYLLYRCQDNKNIVISLGKSKRNRASNPAI